MLIYIEYIYDYFLANLLEMCFYSFSAKADNIQGIMFV
jgi:hypothetical protein